MDPYSHLNFPKMSSKVAPSGKQQNGISCISYTRLCNGSSYQLLIKICLSIWNGMVPMFELNSIIFPFSARETWDSWCFIQNGWAYVPKAVGLAVWLWWPLWILWNKSECESSILWVKTTNSTPKICHAWSSMWGSCAMVTSLYIIIMGFPNQLSILSMAVPISSAKMPTAYVAKKVVSLRACNLLGSTFVHPVSTPFATSSLWRACSKLSFPWTTMHTINVIFASIGMAFWFILAMDILNAISYYIKGQELVCASHNYWEVFMHR